MFFKSYSSIFVAFQITAVVYVGLRFLRLISCLTTSYSNEGNLIPNHGYDQGNEGNHIPNHGYDQGNEGNDKWPASKWRCLKASGSPDMGMVGTEVEKPRHTTSKASGSPVPHVPDMGMVELSEKTKKEVDAQMSKDLHGGSPLKSLAADDIVDELHDAHPVVDSPTVESTGKEENGHVTNEEVFSKEVKTSNEKASKRRASFPAKQEYPENGSHNSPKLPSYMAATKSAKAKLRAQGTAKSGLDGAEQNGSARRHSLPSSKNGKLSSPSPRTQRLVQSSGKGGIKNDMSLLSSRDGNEKVVQVDWRR